MLLIRPTSQIWGMNGIGEGFPPIDSPPNAWDNAISDGQGTDAAGPWAGAASSSES